MIEIRWHGRGGQGSFTVARLLGLAASIYENKYALAFPAFGPERRGAPVLGFTRIDNSKILDRGELVNLDYVIVLDDTLMDESITNGLKSGGTLLVNTSRPVEVKGDFKVVTIDATSLALEYLGRPITNTAMLGALSAISGIVSLESIDKAIDDQMAPRIREKNKALLRAAYNQVKGVAVNG